MTRWGLLLFGIVSFVLPKPSQAAATRSSVLVSSEQFSTNPLAVTSTVDVGSASGTVSCHTNAGSHVGCETWCLSKPGCNGYWYWDASYVSPHRCCPKASWNSNFDNTIGSTGTTSTPGGNFYSYFPSTGSSMAMHECAPSHT